MGDKRVIIINEIKNKYDIVNTDKKPDSKTEDRIFFGFDYGHVIRIDKVSHNIAKVLKEHSEGNTWFSREIDMKEDKTKFDSLPEDAKRAFKLNIIYQILMDSGVTEGLTDTIIRCISTPIWEILYRRIAIEEAVHAESYSYCLDEVFGEETEKIIDLIYKDEIVKLRMEKEAEVFSRLHSMVDKYLLLKKGIIKDPSEKPNDILLKCKEYLLTTLIYLYCLESIKFPFSFLVTFNLNDKYNNAIPGFTRNIRLIANDELNTHVPTFLNLVKILKEDENQEFYDLFHKKINVFEEANLAKLLDIKNIKLETKFSYFETILTYAIHETVEEEIKWAHYLFDGKNVLGLNAKSAEYFIKWRANVSLKNLNFMSNIFQDYVDNSLTNFFENQRDINKHNSALQEATNISYQKGLQNDLNNLPIIKN